MVEVVGLISLGLQVFGEIAQYVDGVTCAKKELTAVNEQLQTYKVMIEAIQRLVASNVSPELEIQEHVQQSIALVERRVRSLRNEVRKLATVGSPTVDATRSADKTSDFGMSAKKKLLFPFRRDKIKDLVLQLEQVNSCLGTWLHIYQIEFQVRRAMENNLALSDIKAGIKSTFNEVIEISQAVSPGPRISINTAKSLTISQTVYNTQPQPSKHPIYSIHPPLKQVTSGGQDSEQVAGCDCAVKNRTTQLSRSIGWLSMISKRSLLNNHEPGCIWGDLPSQTDHTTTVIWHTGGYWHYLPTAIIATYNSRVSILPTVRTFNLVDLEQTPVMRLIDLADELDDLEWDDPAVENEARMYWHSQLLCLYRDRKASPNDVDYRSNRTILHHLRLPSWEKMSPYVRLTWDTFEKLNFSKDTMLCDGLSPWEYYFAKNLPLQGKKLASQHLPWGVGKWLEPEEITEALLTTSSRNNTDEKCVRAFVIAMIMDERRSFLENSTVGTLCQAIVMRSKSKAMQTLEDGVSSWTEPFLGEESSLCAIDLAIMWFPELINSFLCGGADPSSGPNQLGLPRPHPSRHSFLEIAINIGLRYGGQFGKAKAEDYLIMISLALDHDYPVYFHRVAKYLGGSQDMVTWHLADRRRRLLDFARRRLPRARVEQRDLFEDRLVDERVEEVLQALSRVERPIPEGLQPRDLNDTTRLKTSVFEYAWESEELCGRLKDLGFDPEGFIRSRCRDGPFPMVPLLAPLEWDTWRFNFLLGVLNKSATGVGQTKIQTGDETEVPSLFLELSSRMDQSQKIASQVPGAMFLHAMMAYAGYCMPGRIYLGGGKFGFKFPHVKISQVLRRHLLSELVDDCDCSCSVTGCSSLIMFLKGVISPINVEFARKHFSSFSESIIYSGQVLSVIFSDMTVPRSLILQLLRLYTFECLDCRHTCCNESMRRYVWGYVQHWPCDRYDEEDREEIHQEDTEKLYKLEQIMASLEEELDSSDLVLVDLLQDRWLPLIERTMKEESSRCLSHAEVQKMEEFGVKLEAAVSREGSLGHDEDWDTASTVSIRLEYLETDEDRLRVIKNAIDEICK